MKHYSIALMDVAFYCVIKFMWKEKEKKKLIPGLVSIKQWKHIRFVQRFLSFETVEELRQTIKKNELNK